MIEKQDNLAASLLFEEGDQSKDILGRQALAGTLKIVKADYWLPDKQEE